MARLVSVVRPGTLSAGCLDSRAFFFLDIRGRAIRPRPPLTVPLRSIRRRRRGMTFQIFVGGQRVNSADVLNTPAWSHQVRLSPVTSRTCTHVSVETRRLILSLFDDCGPTRVSAFSSKTSRKRRRVLFSFAEPRHRAVPRRSRDSFSPFHLSSPSRAFASAGQVPQARLRRGRRGVGVRKPPQKNERRVGARAARAGDQRGALGGKMNPIEARPSCDAPPSVPRHDRARLGEARRVGNSPTRRAPAAGRTKRSP